LNENEGIKDISNEDVNNLDNLDLLKNPFD